MEQKIFLPDEVASQLRCSRRQIYDLYREGELIGFRVGTHIKISADSVDDYIRRHSNVKPLSPEPDGVFASPSTTPNLMPLLPPAASPSSRPRQVRPAHSQVGFRHLRF